MKAYLITDGEYYSNNDVTAAFFDKQKAIDFMESLAEKYNVMMSPTDDFRYMWDEKYLSWSTPLSFIEIQEIEIV